jgi:hypothetical protein
MNGRLVVFRVDAAFAKPEICEALAEPGVSMRSAFPYGPKLDLASLVLRQRMDDKSPLLRSGRVGVETIARAEGRALRGHIEYA